MSKINTNSMMELFRKILGGGKTEVRADLSQPRDKQKEVEEKDVIMSARELLFEQKRIVKILQQKFEHLSVAENLDEYCERLGISEGVKADMAFALPEMIKRLESGDLFKSEIYEEEMREYTDQYLAGNLKLLLGEMGQEALNLLLNAEIDLAGRILTEQRKRPVLAHRGRGFGEGERKDEASQEALADALKKNVAEMEFDIRMSKDKQPMIHHNATLGASAGRAEAIKNLTAEDLERVELKNGNHITSLKAFLDKVLEIGNETTKINIDIKDFDEAMLEEILRLVQERKMEHRVVMVSWFPQALQYLYEKDPTLSYSLSYFPAVRGISRWFVEKVSQLPTGSLLFGKIGSWVAKKRSEAMSKGENKVQGTGSEMITEAIILDANKHWQEMKRENEAEGAFVGRHEFAYGDDPIELSGEDKPMVRVLRNGSINIMAFEELIVSTVGKIPVLKKFKKQIANLFGRRTKLIDFAERLLTNGVKVNLFDVYKEEDIQAHFESFEEKGVQAGVVYSSNSRSSRFFDSRGQYPDLKAEDLKKLK